MLFFSLPNSNRVSMLIPCRIGLGSVDSHLYSVWNTPLWLWPHIMYGIWIHSHLTFTSLSIYLGSVKICMFYKSHAPAILKSYSVSRYTQLGWLAWYKRNLQAIVMIYYYTIAVYKIAGRSNFPNFRNRFSLIPAILGSRLGKWERRMKCFADLHTKGQGEPTCEDWQDNPGLRISWPWTTT